MDTFFFIVGYFEHRQSRWTCFVFPDKRAVQWIKQGLLVEVGNRTFDAMSKRNLRPVGSLMPRDPYFAHLRSRTYVLGAMHLAYDVHFNVCAGHARCSVQIVLLRAKSKTAAQRRDSCFE